MRLTIPLLIILVVTPTAAQATTTLAGEESQTQALFQSWIASSLAPTPNVTVPLHFDACPQNIAPNATWCTDQRTHGIWTGADYGYLWRSPSYSDRDHLVVQLTFLHELGHVIDNTVGPKDYRRRFAQIMGYRKGGDWLDAQTNDGKWVRPDEQFAMAYGFCSLYAHYDDAAYARSVWWGYSYAPSKDQFERACHLVRSLDVASTEEMLSFRAARRAIRSAGRDFAAQFVNDRARFKLRCQRVSVAQVRCATTLRAPGLKVRYDAYAWRPAFEKIDVFMRRVRIDRQPTDPFP